MSVHVYSLKWDLIKSANKYIVTLFRTELGVRCPCCSQSTDSMSEFALTGSFSSPFALSTGGGQLKNAECALPILVDQTLLLCQIFIPQCSAKSRLIRDLILGASNGTKGELAINPSTGEMFVAYLSPIHAQIDCPIEVKRS